MSQIELTYVTEIIVTVEIDPDGDICEVVCVQVDDEGAKLSPDDAESTDPDVIAAREVADEAMWPAWSFGF